MKDLTKEMEDALQHAVHNEEYERAEKIAATLRDFKIAQLAEGYLSGDIVVTALLRTQETIGDL